MPSSPPLPVPSTTTNLPSNGVRPGGQGQPDRSTTLWTTNEKLPGSKPSNVPQKMPVFVWNALCFTASSLTTVCRGTDVPCSDPVYVFTAYCDRVCRSA